MEITGAFVHLVGKKLLKPGKLPQFGSGRLTS
jgi:hypothetical protein